MAGNLSKTRILYPRSKSGLNSYQMQNKLNKSCSSKDKFGINLLQLRKMSNKKEAKRSKNNDQQINNIQ